MAKSAEKREPTFEEALEQLESIVTAIEEGKIGLEDAVAEYERGVKLLRRCQSILARAETRIQQLQVAEDGSVSTTPMAGPDADANSETSA